MTAKIFEAYFCSGAQDWPLDVSDDEKHLSFRASVISAHFLICNQIREFPRQEEYREKMLEEMLRVISKILADMDEDMETCLAEKTKCQMFEHICGSNKVGNFRNALRYIQFSLKGDPGKISKIVLNITSKLLENDKVENVLSFVSFWCPEKSKYCDSSSKAEPQHNTRHLQSNEGKQRKKRFYSQYDMMRLFNRIVCDKELMMSLAEFWDTNYIKLDHSRVWIIGIASEAWCCWIQFLDRNHEEYGW